MFNPNDDDDFFNPTASSNLVSLFGTAAETNSSADLKYKAPKQPRNSDHNSDRREHSKPKVLCAKVVVARKLVDNAYKRIGKFGFALVGHDVFAQEILLYKDNQHILAKITISDDFQMITDSNCTLEFVDDDSIKWSAQFNNVGDCNCFVQHLQSRQVRVIQKSDTNKTRPSSRENDSTFSTPRERNDVKEKKVPSDVRERNDDGESDGGSDENPNTQIRADILQRMAKMGQSVLPGSKRTPRHSTASESDADDNSDIKKRATRKLRPTYTPVETPTPSKTNQLIPNSDNQNFIVLDNQLIKVQPYNCIQPSPIYADLKNPNIQNQDFNMFLSENRTHNSEVRINLTSISSKVDTILGEIYRLKSPPNTDKLENEYLKSKILDLQDKLSTLEDISMRSSEDEKELKNKETQIDELNKTVIELEVSLQDADRDKIELNKLKINEEEYLRTIEELNMKIKNSDDTCEDLEKELAELQQLYDNISEENEKLIKRNEYLEGELELTENMLQKSKTKEAIESDIKETMNKMFQNILLGFDENSSLTYKQIKSALSKQMKHTTFDIINMMQSSK